LPEILNGDLEELVEALTLKDYELRLKAIGEE